MPLMISAKEKKWQLFTGQRRRHSEQSRTLSQDYVMSEEGKRTTTTLCVSLNDGALKRVTFLSPETNASHSFTYSSSILLPPQKIEKFLIITVMILFRKDIQLLLSLNFCPYPYLNVASLWSTSAPREMTPRGMRCEPPSVVAHSAASPNQSVQANNKDEAPTTNRGWIRTSKRMKMTDQVKWLKLHRKSVVQHEPTISHPDTVYRSFSASATKQPAGKPSSLLVCTERPRIKMKDEETCKLFRKPEVVTCVYSVFYFYRSFLDLLYRKKKGHRKLFFPQQSHREMFLLHNE